MSEQETPGTAISTPTEPEDGNDRADDRRSHRLGPLMISHSAAAIENLRHEQGTQDEKLLGTQAEDERTSDSEDVREAQATNASYSGNSGDFSTVQKNVETIAGGFSAVQKNVETWHKEISGRICLLIYAEGDKDEETQTFKNDCESMERSLTVTSDKEARGKTRSYVIPAKETDSYFLSLMAEREQQVTTGLETFLEKEFPKWSSGDRKEIVLDMYVRFRLVKAMEGFDNNKEEGFGIKQLPMLKALVGRWKEAYKIKDLRERTKWLNDNKNLAQKVEANSRDNYVVQYGKSFRKGSLTLFSKHDSAVLQNADEIFLDSMYLSGFPKNRNLLKRKNEGNERDVYREFFNYPIKLAEDATNKMHTEEIYGKLKLECPDIIKKDEDRAVEYVVNNFHKWRGNKFVQDQWIWIHYSGHGHANAMEAEPLKNLNRMIRLASELYTNFVLSLDCCYPSLDLCLPRRSFCIILPHDDSETIPYNRMVSDFSKLLCFALDGFDCDKCLPLMQTVQWGLQQCKCLTCSDYMLQFAVRGTNSDARLACEHCKQLRDKCVKKGSIFPRQIMTYLQKHLCAEVYKPSVVVQLSDERPLMLLRECFGIQTVN